MYILISEATLMVMLVPLIVITCFILVIKRVQKTNKIQEHIEKNLNDGKKTKATIVEIKKVIGSNTKVFALKMVVEIHHSQEPPFTISAVTTIRDTYRDILYPNLQLWIRYNPQDLKIIAVDGFVDQPVFARIIEIIYSKAWKDGGLFVRALLEISPESTTPIKLEGEFDIPPLHARLIQEDTKLHIRYNPTKTPAPVFIEKIEHIAQQQKDLASTARLRELKTMLDEDLITQEEYNIKKKEILAAL